MKTLVLIKYSIFSLFFLNSCNSLSTKKMTVETDIINVHNNVTKTFIIKTDTISLNRKSIDRNNVFLDTITLKQGFKNVKIIFPSIGHYNVELRKNVPKKEMYDYYENKFLVQANYKDLIIQYVFNDNIENIEKIFIITNVDEVYPDFNKSSNDTIAKIEIINPVLNSKDLYNYLSDFSQSFINRNYEINTVVYIQRKEGIQEYINQ